MKIVVYVPNWIGDSILALPAVESLHINYPEAEIWIAAQGWVKDIFANIHFIKGIIPLPAQKSFKDLRKTAKNLVKIKKIYEPIVENHNRYIRIYKNYRKIQSNIEKSFDIY